MNEPEVNSLLGKVSLRNSRDILFSHTAMSRRIFLYCLPSSVFLSFVRQTHVEAWHSETRALFIFCRETSVKLVRNAATRFVKQCLKKQEYFPSCGITSFFQLFNLTKKYFTVLNELGTNSKPLLNL